MEMKMSYSLTTVFTAVINNTVTIISYTELLCNFSCYTENMSNNFSVFFIYFVFADFADDHAE